MSELYPLLLLPEFHERVWGTRDLRPFFSRTAEASPIGEVWLTGEDCKVANGPLSGRTLRELAEQFGPELIGEAAPTPQRFPLLIKWLFPREKLSVQVHPDDEGAQKVGQPNGKTECWYVARSVAGAQVGLGLRPGVDREHFRRAIDSGHAEELMNWIDVKTGEMIYVDAGTVHAIGPNAIFIETQQNSDITYRLYDYGRPRELHLERGMEAIRERTHAGKVEPQTIDQHDLLVAAPSFIVEKFRADQPLTITADPGARSVQVLVAADGGAVVEVHGSSPVSLMRGECVVIPASVREFVLRPQWSVEFLRMRVPSEQIQQPVTSLPAEAGIR